MKVTIINPAAIDSNNPYLKPFRQTEKPINYRERPRVIFFKKKSQIFLVNFFFDFLEHFLDIFRKFLESF